MTFIEITNEALKILKDSPNYKEELKEIEKYLSGVVCNENFKEIVAKKLMLEIAWQILPEPYKEI